jgi:hypothetical protein
MRRLGVRQGEIVALWMAARDAAAVVKSAPNSV